MIQYESCLKVDFIVGIVFRLLICVKGLEIFSSAIKRRWLLKHNKNYREVKTMAREGIHPTYHQATVTCNCGNTFVTGSTKKDIHVEICAKCHPFYTGQQKATQARGRVDKFNKKYGMQ